MPSRVLLVGGPLWTPSETVALGKAEAPGSAASAAAGGRFRRALVMKRQRDRVEHILPVALFPPPVLREVDTKARVAVRDGDCDFRLLGLAVADDILPHALRGVGREVDAAAPRETTGVKGDAVQLVEPRHRVPVGLLYNDDSRMMGAVPAANVLAHSASRPSFGTWRRPSTPPVTRRRPWSTA